MTHLTSAEKVESKEGHKVECRLEGTEDRMSISFFLELYEEGILNEEDICPQCLGRLPYRDNLRFRLIKLRKK
jgi:hypothetical protein